MKKIRKNRGITLISLVVTIIVLLILAGITINMLFGDNGLLNKTKEATEEYSKSEARERVELLLSEYTIEKATGENTDFARFLRKNLQVGVAQNEDDTYSFMLGEWQVIATENEVISIEKFKLDVDKTYPSVASMKADTELTEGQLVQTESYWDKQYAGGAYYDIISSTSLIVDDGKCIQLDNGLYAELHAINDTVTVNQFGAYGDGEHDDAEAINKAINAGFPNIQFKNSEYRINSRIDITSSNLALLGNNSTIFYDDDFEWKDNFIVGIYNNSEYVKNIYMDDITIIDKNSTYENPVFMIKVMGIENFEMFKCNLEAYNINGNTNRHVTNIDFSNHYANIWIEECNLINTTLGPEGGSIWLRGGTEGTGNVTIKNNYIEKSCHDEPIAIFSAGVVENINIDSNTILVDDTNVPVPSNPVFNLGSTSIDKVRNLNFVNNDVTIIANGLFMRHNNAENILVSNNKTITTCLRNERYAVYFTAGNSTNVEYSNNVIEITHNIDNLDDQIFRSIDKINNNKITLNTGFNILFENISEINNNEINFNKRLGENSSIIYGLQNKTLENEVRISNNKLNFNINMTNNIRLFSLYSSYINNHNIEITNNIVKGVEEQDSNIKYAFYFQLMKDSTPQYVYSRNNDFGFFSNNIGNVGNSTTYSVIED